MRIHIVESGQTIFSIANQYGISQQRLIYDNQLNTYEPLVVGQALVILIPIVTHTVAAGETIESIALMYGISPVTIYRNNSYLLLEPFLREGEIITIQYEGEKIGSMYVDGYAYPYINDVVLAESLLYLSYLSSFSYGYTTSGELIPIEDTRIIEASRIASVKPMLVLTPFGSNGNFNNQLVNTLLEQEDVQSQLIENLYAVVKQKQYAGVNVDFEFILAEDKERYVEFVRRLRERLSPEGYLTSVCLAPKTSVDQPGLLYEGIDYKGLGEAADYVFCMTYEWGYTYSPPMSVSPINQVRKVLEFAISQINPEKILMGMSNYGYDWTLPFVRGTTKAVTIGNLDAIVIARENGASIQYNEQTQTPFFRYTKDGLEHEVWFEDARSINARLRLVPEYGLKGVGYWQLMKYFRQNFMVLNSLFNIIR